MAEITEYHRKYRPFRLSQYIGNKRIIESTLKFLPLERKPQVLLLSGHSGCGKTTFARLICSCYCCTDPLPTGDACGECDYCKAFQHYIETGDHDELMNIHEIDSAIINGKDDIEPLIDEMSLPSLDGNWKCYIFDECHRLSSAAQSSLLKTVEEPPEKVLICLCTTDPDKLLGTIVSRCQRNFMVTKPKRSELVEHLSHVCTQEKVTYDMRALSLVATKGNLVPRDSLIALQNVVHDCGEVTYNKTVEDLNLIVDKYYFTFYEMLTQKVVNVYKYVSFISDIKEQMELPLFLEGLITFTTRGIYIYNGVQVDGLDPAELKPYAVLFAKFSPQEVAFLLNYLSDLRDSPNIETKLLLLGYTGIVPQVQATIKTADSLTNLDNLSTSAASDETAGNEAFNEATKITPAEVDSIIKNNTASVPLDDMLSMFNGRKIMNFKDGDSNG